MTAERIRAAVEREDEDTIGFLIVHILVLTSFFCQDVPSLTLHLEAVNLVAYNFWTALLLLLATPLIFCPKGMIFTVVARKK